MESEKAKLAWASSDITCSMTSENYNASHCGVSVVYCPVLYCVALSCIVLYHIALYCIVCNCPVLYCIVLHCIVLYVIVLYCILSYCIVLYCMSISKVLTSSESIPVATDELLVQFYKVSFQSVLFNNTMVLYYIIRDIITACTCQFCKKREITLSMKNRFFFFFHHSFISHCLENRMRPTSTSYNGRRCWDSNLHTPAC